MMTQQRTVSARLTATVDTSAIAASVAANAKITSSYADMKKAAEAVGLTVEELARRTGVTVDAQKTAAAAVTTSAQQVVSANQQTAQSYTATADAATLAADKQVAASEKAAQAAQSAALKQGAGRIAGLGSVVGASGGAAFRDASQIVQLGVSYGAVGAAVGVLAVGLRLVTDNATKAAEALQASAKAYSDVAEAALTATRKQLEAERDALKLRLDLDQQLADQANEAVLKFSQQPGFSALSLLDGTFRGLQGSADDANKKLTDTQNQLNAYNIVLADGSATIQDIRNQITAFGDQLGGKFKGAVSGAADFLNKALADIDTANESRNTALTDALTLEGEARQDLYTSATAAGEFVRESRIKREALLAEGEAKHNEIVSDGEARRAEIASSAAEQRVEIDARGEEARAKILRDANATISNATRARNALAAFLAIQARNTQLADQVTAQKQQEDSLDKSTAKQIAQQDKAQQKQLEQANKAQQKTLEQFDAAYKKQFALNAKEVSKAEVALEQALANQRSIEAAGNAQREAYEIVHQRALYNTLASYGAVIRTEWDNVLSYVANRIRSTYDPVTSGKVPNSNPAVFGSGSKDPRYQTQQERDRQAAIAAAYQDYYRRQGMPVQGYARGIANVPFDQLAYLHRGERVLTAQQNRMLTPNGGGGGITVNVPITGTQLRKRDIVRIVDQQVDATLSAAGYD